MKHSVLFWFAALACLAVASSALAHQDPSRIKQSVDDFLRTQMSGLPGDASYTIGTISPNNRLAPCASMDATMAPGGKSWGRTTVVVRCLEENGWSIYVPVHIRVVSDYLVTAAPLAQGQTIEAADLTRRRGDLSDLPAGIITDDHEALGRTAAVSIGAGRPLRADMLRQPTVIRQNQTVKVVSKGMGFQVTNEGRALTNALDGQIVQVRLGTGQVISGVAKSGGIVEVGF